MKVLMIAPEPFLEPRGTPISVFQRLNGLSRMGSEVDLVTYHLGEDVPIPGVTVYRILRVPFIKHVKIGPSFTKLILDFLLAAKAVGRLLRERYDVIHSHEEAAFLAMLLAAIFDTSHVYDMHSSLPKQLESFGFGNVWPIITIFRQLERAVLRTCDAVITIDDDLSEYVVTINPSLLNYRIENLPILVAGRPPADLPLLEAIKQRVRGDKKIPVIYTGSFERYQGLELLLRAAHALPKEIAERVMFVLVGGKPAQIAQLQRKAAELGIGNLFVFTGTVSLDAAAAYLEWGEILVSPRLEGTSVPLKIYSYLGADRAILATNIRAHRLVLNDEIALLVSPTAEALADGLARLIRDPLLRGKLATGAKEHAQMHYDPANYATKLNGLYSQLQASRTIASRPQSVTER